MLRTLLIANRGEIACRIIRTARRMGLRTVAVFSDADANALHVQLADEAIRLGPAPAIESYLRADAVLAAAQACGAEAIHPGYGFLSENAGFARAVEQAGLRFVGPPAAAIEAMGSKSRAKTLMEAAEVPLLPGFHGEAQDLPTLQAAADTIGYPLLIKAAAGGGGKGMRQVHAAADFATALSAVQREARGSFGDDRVLIERYLVAPRHVEVQVFCDDHGHGIYLGDRDCSMQRRHQKVIEEAPAPGIPAATREAMGTAAVRSANAIGYSGAGTVEFLLDADGSFYFMEMNTRLQVEHPVTEFITGLDLVEWQLRIAAGEPLPLAQEAVQLHGHAMEARIYAEDTTQDFLPAAGRLALLQMPPAADWLRIDSGIRAGDEVSVHYDPMIAKLIVWGQDRKQAQQRLVDALSRYHIAGLPTNLAFLRQLAAQADFAAARLSTHLIEDHRAALCTPPPTAPEQVLLAALAVILHRANSASAGDDPWLARRAWRLNAPPQQTVLLRDGDRLWQLALTTCSPGWQVTGDAGTHWVDGSLQGQQLTAVLDGHRRQLTVLLAHHTISLFDGRIETRFDLPQPDLGDSDALRPDACVAPMNGRIVALLAAAGDAVTAGTGLVIIEAMKMEHTVRAPKDGTIEAILVAAGDLVDGGTELLRLCAVAADT